MKNYFYVVFNNWDNNTLKKNEKGYYTICLKDLETVKDVLVVSHPADCLSPLLRFLFAVHNSERINKHINLPFKKIWFKHYFKTPKKIDKPFCFVILEPKISVNYYAYLRRKYKDCKIVAVYRDFLKVYLKSNPLLENGHYFDLEFSYDELEAREKGMIYFEEFESKIIINDYNSFPKCDVFFAGKAKDRLKIILEICEKLTSVGYVCNFFITHANDCDKKNIQGVTYMDKDFSYYEMLCRSLNAKCLLDINQNGAIGFTSRFLEAVMYNKKLITNNKAVLKSKYYNSRFIQYIESANDLNPHFVDDSIVNFNYSGDFSPINLINKIDDELSK